MHKPLTSKDRDFLASYRADDFPHPSVAVDLCLFAIRDGAFTVHLVERAEPPYQGVLALPGGFVRMDESLDEAARRVLREKAGLERAYLEQLYSFGDVDRDPRTRVVSVAYCALVTAEAISGANGLSAVPVDEARGLAFDHDRIVDTAARRIRGKLSWTTVAFELMPAEFTLTELQRVYEIILAKKLTKPAFRRKILDADVIVPTDGMRRGGHRPAQLYRFCREDGDPGA